MFVDADDQIHPQICQIFLRLLRERFKKIYISDKHKYWVVWCKLYRKELFAEKRFELGKKYEDNGLIFELLL